MQFDTVRFEYNYLFASPQNQIVEQALHSSFFDRCRKLKKQGERAEELVLALRFLTDTRMTLRRV